MRYLNAAVGIGSIALLVANDVAAWGISAPVSNTLFALLGLSFPNLTAIGRKQ